MNPDMQIVDTPLPPEINSLRRFMDLVNALRSLKPDSHVILQCSDMKQVRNARNAMTKLRREGIKGLRSVSSGNNGNIKLYFYRDSPVSQLQDRACRVVQPSPSPPSA